MSRHRTLASLEQLGGRKARYSEKCLEEEFSEVLLQPLCIAPVLSVGVSRCWERVLVLHTNAMCKHIKKECLSSTTRCRV